MRSALVFFTAIVLSVLTLQASAQPPTDRESARQLFFDGHKALKAEDYATASELFERAEAMYHAPTTLLGLARARVGMGKLLPAYETYQRILSERLPGSPPPAYAKAIADAQAESAALEPRLAALVVSVSGAPNASVAIDGKVIETDDQHYVEPGEHQVTAIARGFLDAKISVTVAAQERKSVELKLRPTEPRRARESRKSEAAAPDHQDEDRSAERAVGITLTALGVLGLVAGA
ncbi:MAG TPA: PEGA domain-containing protein, partial [Polyangiaceae bacterium]|nr:PEGA domain-containing protein [Polyangiaceae bacterium]